MRYSPRREDSMSSNKNDKSNSVDTSVPKSIHVFVDSLPEKYINGNIDKKLEKEMELEWKKFNTGSQKNKKQKFLISMVSVASIFIIFIMLGFVSPTMANMMTKIPLINILFESESPLNEEIITVLEENNYKWDGVNISVEDKLVSISLLDDKENNKDKMEEIEKVTKEILNQRGYNAYSVAVTIDSLDKNVDTSKSIDGNIRIIDENVMKNDPEVKWATTFIPAISSALTSKTELKVIGISHSYKEGRVYVEIYTSLSSLKAESSKEVVESIKESIKSYLESEKVNKLLNNDKYIINLFNKDKSEESTIMEKA